MDLIPLQKAYGTQTTHEGEVSDWIIYDENQKEIHRLPKGLNEKQLMKAIRMGRKFELEAFNIGINFQKKMEEIQIDALKGTIKQLEAMRSMLATENQRLATELDNLTSNIK